MSDPDGLTREQRTLVERVRRETASSQATGAAMARGDADRAEHNDAQERASRALTAAEAAGVPPDVLDAVVAEVHRADRVPAIAAHRSSGALA